MHMTIKGLMTLSQSTPHPLPLSMFDYNRKTKQDVPYTLTTGDLIIFKCSDGWAMGQMNANRSHVNEGTIKETDLGTVFRSWDSICSIKGRFDSLMKGVRRPKPDADEPDEDEENEND